MYRITYTVPENPFPRGSCRTFIIYIMTYFYRQRPPQPPRRLRWMWSENTWTGFPPKTCFGTWSMSVIRLVKSSNKVLDVVQDQLFIEKQLTTESTESAHSSLVPYHFKYSRVYLSEEYCLVCHVWVGTGILRLSLLFVGDVSWYDSSEIFVSTFPWDSIGVVVVVWS